MKIKTLLIAGALMIPVVFNPAVAKAEYGSYCRSYAKSIRIGDDVKAGYGKACLQPDGSWRVVAAGGEAHPFEGRYHKMKKHNKAHKRKHVRRSYHAYNPYHYGHYYKPAKHYKKYRKHAKHHYRYGHQHGAHCGH